jgi:high-affinity nickel permease
VIARKKYLLNLWKRKEVNSVQKIAGVRFKLPQITEFQVLQITASSKSVTIRIAEALIFSCPFSIPMTLMMETKQVIMNKFYYKCVNLSVVLQQR